MKVYRNLDAFPKDLRKVVTIGSFDGVHQGHMHIVDKMKSLAKEYKAETCVVTFHPHPRQLLYPHDTQVEILSTLEEKIDVFKTLGIQHLIIKEFTIDFSQLSPSEYIEKFLLEDINPTVIVLGYDHRFGYNRQGNIYDIKQYERKHDLITYEIPQHLIDNNKVSSTVIRNALLNGQIAEANKLLGRNYSVEGSVMHGSKVGQTLGFRTANLKITDRYKLIPKIGIYVVKVLFEECYYGGMLYIGTKPTFNEDKLISIEVNIFDFDHIIYNKPIKIEFLSYLRNDMKFESKKDLIDQLKRDEQNSLKYLESIQFEKEC